MDLQEARQALLSVGSLVKVRSPSVRTDSARCCFVFAMMPIGPALVWIAVLPSGSPVWTKRAGRPLSLFQGCHQYYGQLHQTLSHQPARCRHPNDTHLHWRPRRPYRMGVSRHFPGRDAPRYRLIPCCEVGSIRRRPWRRTEYMFDSVLSPIFSLLTSDPRGRRLGLPCM